MSIDIIQNSNTPSILTTAGTVLASRTASGGRRGWSIQNIGTNPIFVRMGDTASTTVFHIILAGGSANDNGEGGYYEEMIGSVFQGIVSIAGTSPRLVVKEYL